MRSTQLTKRHFLDPRPAADAAGRPIRDAVNIPLAELSERTHELPARHQLLPVVGPAEVAVQAVAWLGQNGRRARLRPAWEYAARPDSTLIGHLWRPTEFLAEVLPQLSASHQAESDAPATRTRGALDLACGTGRDAVFLAAHGWHVTAVDLLPDALDLARALAARYAPAIQPIEFVQIDLEADPATIQQQFDLIVVFRYLHRPLFTRFRSWLAPGGSLLCETFTTVHRARRGKPASDAHVLKPDELRELAQGLEIVDISEAWRSHAHTARLWARQPAGR
jgi:SAM-dependent methyltransferase